VHQRIVYFFAGLCDDRKQVDEVEDVALNAGIARKLYELRTKAGFNRRASAKRVGPSASAICRLEDTDYQGNSLLRLKRTEDATDRRVEIGFVPGKRLRTA